MKQTLSNFLSSDCNKTFESMSQYASSIDIKISAMESLSMMDDVDITSNTMKLAGEEINASNDLAAMRRQSNEIARLGTIMDSRMSSFAVSEATMDSYISSNDLMDLSNDLGHDKRYDTSSISSSIDGVCDAL